MQTITNYLILIFALLSQFASCIDLGCLGGGGEDYYPIAVYNVLISDTGQPNLKYLNTFDQNYSNVTNYFDDFQYSIDGQVALFGHRKDLFNHTGEKKFSDSLRYFKTNVSYSDFYDIYPDRREYLTSKSSSQTFTDSVFHHEHSIQGYYQLHRHTVKDSIVSKLLIEYNPFLLDSTTFQQNQILNPKFDLNGNIVFISRKEIFKITSDSLQNNFYQNSYYKEAFVVRLNIDASLDTLVQIPAGTGNYYHHLELTHSTILYSSNGSLSIFDYSGKELAQLPSSGDILANKDGNSLLIADNIYYRIDDGNTFILNDFFSNINQTYPSTDNILVIHDNKSKVSVFDVNSRSISKTIDISEMPEIDPSPSKVSRYTFENPFIYNSKLTFFYIDDFYIDDPDNPCD